METLSCSPYEHTIVMDVDMLVLHDITHWWAELQKRDMFFVSNVRDYRDKIVTSRVYRKTFDENTLPNLYSGIYYFKKSTTAHAFFNFLEIVMTNWELFYGKFAGTCYQDWCSFDLSCSIVSKLLDNTLEITDPNSFITFTHMKPHCQGWNEVPDKWTNVLGSYITKDKTMIIGNYLQRNVLHYVEPEFLTKKLSDWKTCNVFIVHYRYHGNYYQLQTNLKMRITQLNRNYVRVCFR